MKRSVRSLINIAACICTVLASLFAAAPGCFAQELVLLSREELPNQKQIELAARFYGMQVRSVHVASAGDAQSALGIIRGHDVQGVIASADSLSIFSKSILLSALRGNGNRNASLLVVGVQPQDAKVIQEWSDGALTGCNDLSRDGQRRLYQVGANPEVTQQLSNQQLPVISLPSCGFQSAPERKPISLLSVIQGNASLPVFVRTGADSPSIFCLADWGSSSESAGALNPVSAFSSLAPFLMFVHYVGGDFVWHAPQSVANFTIDDPWLTEPYGYLSYRALLQEMEAHNFHTTIAFIPWNFGRSQAEVVALFRDHSDRFSIAIHGNNHDHKEFDSYATVPLADQIADIKQSVARMEKFHTLTDISYDRVMVFPHSVAPEGTFAELKKYNFLATSNADDVPIGSPRPNDPLFYLRSYTADFADFPSLKRYSSEVPLPQIVVAINAFLGNPLLFYGHAAMFEAGTDAFDATANTVNSIAPGTEWRSLGYVAEHLYLLRSRTDGGMDVRFFGNNVVIENPSDTERVFWLQKQENDQPSIKALTVDGQPQAFERGANAITLRVSVPAHSQRTVSIEYGNDLNLAQIATSDPDVRIALLRKASDFRDIVLPKYGWGRWVTHFYYRHQLDSIEMDVESWWFGVAFMSFLVIAFVYARRRRTSKVRANKALAKTAGASR